MARFFIDRPVFAWVVALFICLGGALAIPNLPVAQYPVIAPPSIALSTAYPGASVESLYIGTTRLIEDELNGAANIMSFESTTDSFGSVNITATFQPGTDPSLASVEVQNRLKRVEALFCRNERAVLRLRLAPGGHAVTLVPSMATTAAHVTMLQRSPTYVVSRPAEHSAQAAHGWA